MASNYQDNFIALDHGHLLPEIIINGRYIHRQTHKTLNKVWVGKEYEDPDLFMRDIETESIRLNKEGYNCYVVMNTISPDFLEGYEGKKRIDNEIAAGDKDISERNMILIDIDRSQDTKISATASELKQSETIAWRIKDDLEEAGFPQPTMIMSGNGNHLQVPLDHWPNTEENKDRVKTFLEYLRDNYSTNTHKIDTVVSNASRITKMIDTYAMKGPDTKVRPWRKAVMNQKKNGELLTIQQMDDFLPDKPAPKVEPTETPSHSAEPLQGFDAAAHQPLFSKEVELQRFKDALKHFDPDDDRGEGQFKDGANYLAVVFAGSSLGEEAREITRAWCKQSKEKYIENDFNNDWKSGGNHPNPVTVASMYYYIKKKNEDAFEIGLSDVANGKRFASKFQGSLLSVRDSDIWIMWSDGVGWKKATSDVPMRAAKAVLQDMRDETAKAIKEGKDVKRKLAELSRTSKANNLESMIKMAKTEDGMSVPFDQLDTDHYLLGVQNGVIDLKTKKLIELTPDCYVVKRASVVFDPKADAPRFKQFLKEVLPDPELRKFLLRVLGYLMTGSVREHKWFFFIGEGRNGKGVVARTLMKLLGEYAQKIETHILMQGAPKAQNAASPEILSLQGKRFLSGNETREGQAWDDARIKDMTGGDPQSGRFNHQNNYIQYDPTYKVVVAGNNFPMARDSSKGFWDRIVVFPFELNLTPEQINKDLEEKYIYKELSGILNLLLDGLEDYLENGLQIPKALIDATNKYRDESDLIKQFVRDTCSKDPESRVKVKDVYAEYREWAIDNGLSPLAQPRFSRSLVKQHGITKGADQRSFVGIKLYNDFSRPPPF
tara:strand:+ start:4691 stop:7186 length:2496 start_codon:yes stop_codon:yes gene_type:complete